MYIHIRAYNFKLRGFKVLKFLAYTEKREVFFVLIPVQVQRNAPKPQVTLRYITARWRVVACVATLRVSLCLDASCYKKYVPKNVWVFLCCYYYGTGYAAMSKEDAHDGQYNPAVILEPLITLTRLPHLLLT